MSKTLFIKTFYKCQVYTMLGYDSSLKNKKIVSLYFTHKIKAIYAYSRLALYFENNVGNEANSLEDLNPLKHLEIFFLFIVVINILVRGPAWLLPQILTIWNRNAIWKCDLGTSQTCSCVTFLIVERKPSSWLLGIRWDLAISNQKRVLNLNSIIKKMTSENSSQIIFGSGKITRSLRSKSLSVEELYKHHSWNELHV